jgi:hypothetical protein
VSVNDGVHVGAQVVDRQMHAEFAGGITRTGEQAAFKIDDDDVLRPDKALAETRGSDKQALTVKPGGEVAGRSGSEPEPRSGAAEARELATELLLS